MSMQAILQYCQENQIAYKKEEALKQHCTFKIGGAAQLYCVPETGDQLCALVRCCVQNEVPYFILGKGSNILFSDYGYHGVVITTAKLIRFTVKENSITAECGVPLCEICKTAAENSLAGMEFAYGIPGTVGGAVYMNAGAYGGEIKDVLEKAVYMLPNGEKHQVSAAEMELGYRTSALQKNRGVLLEATFSFARGPKEDIWEKMRDFAGRRSDKQPLDKPSAGSTFKRPEGAFAGALIDQCGLRGYRVGDAAISEKHCGFVVNLGNATCQDVLTLTQKVGELVFEKTGYRLEKEIRVIGERE